MDSGGRYGPWSSNAGSRSFMVTGLAPALLSPGSDDFVPARDVLFRWSATVEAAAYRFERREAGQTSLAERVTTTSTNWAPTRTIDDGRYEWRVVSLDNEGATLATTGWRGFRVDSTHPAVVRKTPLRRARPTANFIARFSERVHNVNDRTLQLHVKGTGKALAARVTLSRAGRVATLNPRRSLVPGKKYTVTLAPGIKDAAGNSVQRTRWTVTARR